MHGFYGRFLQSAEQFPARLAAELQRTSGGVEQLTYSELRHRAESVARWLRDSGMSPGARCAILAGNGPLWVAAYLGVMAAGGVSVPLDTAFNAHQVNKLLWDSGATIIFTDSKHLPLVEKAVQETLVRIVMIDGSGEGRYSNLLSMFQTAADGTASFTPAERSTDDLAVLMYTSGTTADPKGVMLTHGNLLAEAESVFSFIHISERDSILAVLPLFHALAQMANLLLPFAAGARIVYIEEMNTTELLRALSERNVTLFCCVPQFFYLIHERVMQEVARRGFFARLAFRAMMSSSGAARRIGFGRLPGKLFFARIHKLLGPNMRYLITGGSAFDPKIGRDFQRLGFNVLQAYGLTETSGAATATPPKPNVLGSVGRPLPGVQVKIIDPQPEEGVPFPVGEVAIAGGIVMRGYYNRADATAAIIKDGWLLSGDLGYLDPRGNLFITGRRKEMIVLSSGKNIYPEEIEAEYLKSPFIKEICVMGLTSRPGEPFSERLHAVIVPDFDVLRQRGIVNAREVIRFDVENLSAELPGAKRILSFDLWPDLLPRTTTRKLKRFEIQRRVQQQSEHSMAEAAGITNEEPSAEEALWISEPDVQRAIAIIRSASKTKKPVQPSANLELDLGFDSMERVELVVALEQAFGVEVEDKVISHVFTVRELVDTMLHARELGGTAPETPTGTEASGASPDAASSAEATHPKSARPRESAAGWDTVLAAPPDDPAVSQALHTSVAFTFLWFIVARMLVLFVRVVFGLKVSGREKLPRKGPFILSPNHQSFLDAPVVAGLMPWRLFKDMFYVGTSEIFGKNPGGKIPGGKSGAKTSGATAGPGSPNGPMLAGRGGGPGVRTFAGFNPFYLLGRTFKLVPVDPDSNLVNAMRAGAYGLRQGDNLVLYPEGERSIDGTPKRFKKGAAILSTHLQAPIVPVALEGFYQAWPRNQMLPRRARLRVRFGDPIAPPPAPSSLDSARLIDAAAPAPPQSAEDTYKQLTEKLRNTVVEMWESLREKQDQPAPAGAGD
ncbi:MAG: AMP-binding protein [Actinomycetota bacterium]